MWVLSICLLVSTFWLWLDHLPDFRIGATWNLLWKPFLTKVLKIEFIPSWAITNWGLQAHFYWLAVSFRSWALAFSSFRHLVIVVAPQARCNTHYMHTKSVIFELIRRGSCRNTTLPMCPLPTAIVFHCKSASFVLKKSWRKVRHENL